jgi:hypothetical protein
MRASYTCLCGARSPYPLDNGRPTPTLYAYAYAVVEAGASRRVEAPGVEAPGRMAPGVEAGARSLPPGAIVEAAGARMPAPEL